MSSDARYVANLRRSAGDISAYPGPQRNDNSNSRQTLPRNPDGLAMSIDPRNPDMLIQPDSRPISQEQLAAEVKSIYAGLTMVESRCIHVDRAQASAMRNTDQARGKAGLVDDHWQALIALHRTHLHDHHDFFLASQHPSASPALRRLASKHSVPSRMWKRGIHSFLELLRFRLPDSLEFRVSFIYTAYQMMSLLYETVPTFEDTWFESLGDLGRYRMAIEDEDLRDRETWAGVARFLYSKAADQSPGTGRLYHHLDILARPNALQQLYLYSRARIPTQPFHNARDSILTLFNPVLNRSEPATLSPDITSLFLKRIGYNYDPPSAHIRLSLLLSLSSAESCGSQIVKLYGNSAPWKEICAFLNTLKLRPHFQSVDFMNPDQDDARPLPEDHLIRGQICFAKEWFLESEVEDESSIDRASDERVRAERILWISFRLASCEEWLDYGSARCDHESPLALQNSARRSIQVPTQPPSCEPAIEIKSNADGPSRPSPWYALQRFSSWLKRPGRFSAPNIFNKYLAMMMCLAPPSLAAHDPSSTITVSDKTRLIDFSGTIFGAPFFIGVQLVGRRAEPYAWGVMTATSVALAIFYSDTTFSAASRWQLLQAWLFPYGAYIVSKYRRLPVPQANQYMINSFLLSMLLEMVGTMLQNYVPEAMARAAPPSLALGCTLARYLLKDHGLLAIRTNSATDLEHGNVSHSDRAPSQGNGVRETTNTSGAPLASPQRNRSSRIPAILLTPAHLRQPRPIQAAFESPGNDGHEHPAEFSASSPLPSPDAFAIGDSETEYDAPVTQTGPATRV